MPSAPLPGAAIVDQLRSFLLAISLPPPYLLVGHSLGALFANLFARRHPHEVIGVVFLEATTPQDVTGIATRQGPVQRFIENTMLAIVTARGGRLQREADAVRETVDQIAQAGPFPPVPVVVVAGAIRPPALLLSTKAFRYRCENQRALCELSPRSKHVVAAHSGHVPQITEPMLVVAATREVAHGLNSST